MRLSEMLKESRFELLQGSLDIDIANIKYDTRIVEEGDIFICRKGKNIDRHDLFDKAIEKGAKALLVEREIENVPSEITMVKVEDINREMASMAVILNGDPSKDFNLVGVTGTNGKTSVVHYTHELLKYFKKKTGTIGTIGCKIDGKDIPKIDKSTPTTPESPELQKIFRIMKEEAIFAAIIEATSTALMSKRLEFSDFDIGVFLNLTQDHLDDHGTMENYKNEKLKLFKKSKKAIVNMDDVVSDEILGFFKGETLTFGLENEADMKASNLSFYIDSVEFDIEYKSMKRRVKSNIPGRFTVSNILATICIGIMLGFDFDEILEAIPNIKGVRGRLEAHRTQKGSIAIVDYAHSPDALKSILETLNEYAEKKIITVFGCGGDRDRTKRSIMGDIAGKLSNYVIITSDNPRTEDPVTIVNDIESGIIGKGYNYEKIIDREKAIEKAMRISEESDIIVIAGKGHETYQILKDKTIDFDDMKIVKKYDN